jgi:DNA-directed RNA polymerase specialized sigma24 family protein
MSYRNAEAAALQLEGTPEDDSPGGAVAATAIPRRALRPVRDPVHEAFTEIEPRLRAALTPLASPHAVDDSISEAFEYLCGHPEKILSMQNPGGYLYRIARRRLGRAQRKHPSLPPLPPSVQPQVEPGLPAALAALSEKQRVAVFLMAGMQWTAPEVAAFLGVAETSVRTHYDRGLAKLRASLGEVEP